ncbi:MAG: MFS transporter [Anaerolineae bacterium]|nr:MFS transporter [Anaerolineae bacterium]
MEETKVEHTPAPDRGWLKLYIPLFVGQIFSLLGSTLVQFAIVWWLTETTGSSAILASGTIAIIVPGALLGPFLGTLVDRLDRRLVMIANDTIITLGTIFLMLMFWLDLIQVWHVFVVFGLSSLMGSMQWTANTAVMSTIVPDTQLQRVQGITTTLQAAVHIAGPPLGALLMGLLPVYGVLAIDVVTAVIAIVILSLLRLPKVVRHDEGAVTPRRMWTDFKEGLRFILAWRGLFYVIIGFALMNAILEPIFTFFPLLVTQYFGLGALELGSINAAWGLGMVAGGLLMSAWGGFKKKVNTMIIGNLVMGLFLAIVAAAAPHQFWLALVGIFLTASANPMNNAASMSLLQSRVPKHLQGRVLSLASSMVTITIPISLAIAGPLAEVTGVHPWYWIGAVGMIVISVAFLLMKPIRTIEEQELPETFRAVAAE